MTFRMFKTWWEDRQKHWTDRLVIPEVLVYSIRLAAHECGRLPPLVAGNPKMRWGRLSVLLQILTELTADTWGNPRQIYSKVQGC